MHTSEPLDIVMTTWHRPEMTARMITELEDKTDVPYRLTVVDNDSPDEMQQGLLNFKMEGLIHNLILLSENIGLEPAKNIGLGFVKSPWFVSTDNDCLPSQCWLGKLVQLTCDNPDYVAISCRTQVMIGTGNIFEGHEDEEILEFPHPGGSLRIMNTQAVLDVGGWRNDVNSRGQEEKYICGKLREKGFKTGFAVKIKTYHMFGDGNWGYDDNWKPEDHGHTPIWHPALNGDNEERIKEWLNKS